jgi:hypothetical protein
MSPLHNIHSLFPRPENDFGPENRPEQSTPRWVEKPFEAQEYTFEVTPCRPPGLKHLPAKKQHKTPSKRKAS